MRIGYPCINRTIGCSANRTFRLASYSRERLEVTVRENLTCLGRILSFNRIHGILFFRITSDLVPFASHAIMDVPWQNRFRNMFREIGRTIRDAGIRVSMHPDPFTLLNSPDEAIVGRSIAELRYHADVLDAMDLDTTAKIQIHVGGVYNDREEAIRRFIDRIAGLDKKIRRRLAIENDELRFPLMDCLRIHGETGLPVILDTFHHELHHRGEALPEAIDAATLTWSGTDGVPMVDYSSQEEGRRRGTHATSLDRRDFRQFLRATRHHDLDIMLEIKDKERSALRALDIADADPRLVRGIPSPETDTGSRKERFF